MAKRDGNQSKVSLASLTDEEAIFKAVRNKCIQSPLTILPLSLSGGIGLLTAAFGLGFFGAFTSAVLGLLGAAAFVYNMWIRGETLTKRHIQSMMEQLKQERSIALSEVQEMCLEIGLPEAAKEASELSSAYSNYTEFLETRAGSKLGAAVGQRLTLAESARKAGVEHLRQAAEIHSALTGINIDMLRSEHANWIEERKRENTNGAVLDRKLNAHSHQINRYNQLTMKRDEHIARSNELEAALKSAYMSDAGRSDLSLDESTNNPATRLSNVVAAAEAAETDVKEFLQNVQLETSNTL